MNERPVSAPPRKPSPGPAHRLVALAAQIIGVPDATFTVVDGSLQGVLASTRSRLGDELDGVGRLSEAVAVTGEPLLLADLATAESGAGSGAAGAFLGVPVLGPQDNVVGVLYVTDTVPRTFSDADLRLLTDLAGLAADHLDLTRRANELDGPGERGVPSLIRAISHGEIVPWYQPLVDLDTGRMVGVEALARWEHPDGSLDEPVSFIPLAERTNLIVDLDQLVIRQALTDLRRWQDDHPDLRLSVNLSGRHLDLDDWAEVISGLVRATGVAPQALTLELTETARPTSTVLSTKSISRLRAAGFQVWFDDFGTGWAALQELLSFPLDGIKIDRFFAAELGQRIDDTIVKAVATAAAELGLKVTMEGVESAEQAAIAQELGCHYGQGFYWSPAVPATELTRLLATADGKLPVLA